MGVKHKKYYRISMSEPVEEPTVEVAELLLKLGVVEADELDAIAGLRESLVDRDEAPAAGLIRSSINVEVIEECRAPGAPVSAIALAHRINANVVRKWIVRHEVGSLGRRRRKSTPVLLPVEIEERSGGVSRAQSMSEPTEGALATIEVEFARARVCVRGAVDASALRMVLEVLGRS